MFCGTPKGPPKPFVTVSSKFYSCSVSIKKVKQPLSVTHPDLAKEADGWDPATVTYGSGKKMSWKCKLGHRYTTMVHKRTSRGHSCPYCSGHQVLSGFNDLATTHPEFAKQAVGWDPKLYSFGSEFNAQWKCSLGHVWNSLIINRVKQNTGCAVCANTQIIVGVNDLSTTHPEIAKQAFQWDPRQMVAGSEKKVDWICSLNHIWKTSPVSRTRIETGCPFCAGQKVLAGFNDIETTHPEIAKEAYGWDPKTVTRGNGDRKKWSCQLGHVWNAVVSSRTLGSGCPYCTNQKVLAGFNDLQTVHPLVAQQADGWDPTVVIAGSNKIYRWKCPLGHTWRTRVAARTSGKKTGCPSCTKSGFDPNLDGYLYFLQHEKWEMLQIGITSHPESRLGEHIRNGWVVIEVRGPMDGLLTQQWETDILRMLRSKGADLSNSKIAGKFDGYSEAWSKATFVAKSIKQLMQLTEDFEEEKQTH